ncbi:MAG: putative selenocysteine system protein [Promethearchaeota archaeon]
MTILERFNKAKTLWTNKKIVIENNQLPQNWTQNEAFFASYHAINGPSARNIFFKNTLDTDPHGNIAIFLNKTNQFYQVEATDRGLELTVWVHPDIIDKMDEIISGLQEKTLGYIKKIEDNKDKKKGIINTIKIEHHIDEVINNAMNGESSNAVYFSIGKVREFAANIPLLMNASGASIFQLSLNKWMSLAQQIRAASPEQKFPAEKVKPLLAEALKWKKYVMDFLNGTW